MKPAALRIISLLVLLVLAGWLVVDRMSQQEEQSSERSSNRVDRGSRPAIADEPADEPSNHVPVSDMKQFLLMAKDASIDADERERRIIEVGQAGDIQAAHALMELGDQDTYLNFAAINALANIKEPEVETYLIGKLQHGDSRMVAAAAASLAAIQGKNAIPAIASTLEHNRLRADGQQDVVCAACVEAFKQIGDGSALPALAEELDKTVGVSLSYDYGSQVVSVIRAIGDPSGIPILQSYLDRLSELKTNSSDNPKAQHFFQSEITKAMEAIVHLGAGHE